MNNKLIGLTISLMVGVLLLGSLLIPIINTSTEGLQKTFTNTGSVLLSPVEEGETVTGSIDFTNEIVTVNGVVQSLDYPKEQSAVLFAENCMVGYNYTEGVMVPVLDYWNGTEAKHITSSNITSIEFEVAADHSISVTYVAGGDSEPLSIPVNDWILVKDDNGSFVECTKYSGGTVYTDSIDNVYAGSWTFVDRYQFGVKGNDATVNGTEASVHWDSETIMSGVTAIDISYVQQLSYVTFTKSDNTEATSNIQIVVVPVSVTGVEESLIPGLSLLNVIPVFVVIGLLGIAVTYVRSRY